MISDLARFAYDDRKVGMVNHAQPNSAAWLCWGQATAKQLAIVRLFSPYQSCQNHFCGENNHYKDKSVRKEVKPLGTLLSDPHSNSPRFEARMGTRDSFRAINA